MTRKAFTFSLLIVVVLAFAGTPLWAGGAQEPADVDRLLAAMPTPPLETNRFWASGWANFQQYEPMLETLLGTDRETGEVTPKLAESWERRNDDREWVFHLREGVQFHHGYGELTAEDVRHTWELLSRDDSAVNQALVWRDQVTDVEVVDDYTVIFHFENPMTFGEQLFSRAGGELYIVSKDHWETGREAAIDEKLVGTGPYQYVERVDGESLLVEAFDDHWRDEVPFQEILFEWVDDDTTALARLIAGEAHIAEMSRDVAAAAENQGMRIITSTQENMQRIVMFGGASFADQGLAEHNDPDHPLSFREVRQALSLAIDLDELHEEIYYGRIAKSYNTGWHETRDVWNPEWEERFDELHGYDPERARELLAEAGFEEGDITLTLISTVVPAQPEAQEVIEALPSYWEEIGVNTVIQPVDFGTYIARWQDMDTFDEVQVIRNFPIRPTEQYIMDQLTHDGALTFFYTDQTTQDLWEELRVELDADRRRELQMEVGNHAFEQIPYIPIGQTFGEVVVNPEIIEEWVWPGQNPYGPSHWYAIERAE